MARRKGQLHTEETKERMRLAKLGKKRPEADKTAISDGVRRWWQRRRPPT